MKKMLLVLSVIVLSNSLANAQKKEVVKSNKPGWHRIGEVTVNFKADKDVIAVLGADKFKAIKLKVTDAPIRMDDLKVVYENESTEDLQVRAEFAKGGETRVIDLKGGDRNLKKVIFFYKTVPNWKGEKAHVELYGLK